MKLWLPESFISQEKPNGLNRKRKQPESENSISENASANNTIDSWDVVDLEIDNKYFGIIIGKGGRHIKHLQERFGLEVQLDESINKFFIRGSA